MIRIKETLCTGCCACLEVCPTGALSVDGGLASVDPSLCTECEACLGVCPENAIESVSNLALQPSGPQPGQAQPQVIHMTRPQPPSQLQAQTAHWASRIVPVVVGALVSLGRELPRILPPLLDILDGRRQAGADSARSSTSPSTGSSNGGGGQQRRRRRRGE
jgi:NAD-dependent dihydropyrimidine dehydrogenase PreA subunit